MLDLAIVANSSTVYQKGFINDKKELLVYHFPGLVNCRWLFNWDFAWFSKYLGQFFIMTLFLRSHLQTTYLRLFLNTDSFTLELATNWSKKEKWISWERKCFLKETILQSQKCYIQKWQFDNHIFLKDSNYK